MDGKAESPISIAPKTRLFPSCRLTITMMAFVACLLTYMLRLNLSIAIVSMVKTASEQDINSTPSDNNSVSSGQILISNVTHLNNTLNNYINNTLNAATPTTSKGEFDWTKKEVGLVLSCFFYGYILTQVPSGWLCEKFGGKIILITGIGITSLLTMAIPSAAKFHLYTLIAVRIIQGTFSAVAFPSLHTIVGGWAPEEERGLLMSLAYSGMYMGTLLNFPLCSLIADYIGWSYVFYITGSLGIIWTFLAIFLIYDAPHVHPFISKPERAYLESTSEEPASHDLIIPWRQILTSRAVWAINISHLSANWGLYTFALNLPLYMDNVLKFGIKEIGLLLSIPYICTLVVNLTAGQVSDIMHKKNFLSLTKMRKLFNTIGMVCPAILMAVLTIFSYNQRFAAVATISCCQALAGIAFAGGFFYNHVDIAPQFAGILMGMSNMLAQLPGVFSPTLVGIMTPNGTRSEWAIVYYLCTGMYALGAITYLFMGTADHQPWAMEKPDHLVFEAPTERLRPLDMAPHRRPSLKKPDSRNILRK